MTRFRLFVLAAAAPLLLTGAAAAQEPIRFARMPDISPDGKFVAFSYLGDIWCVDAIGGVARPITTHQAHDITPVFSPDGGQIAFSSNRHGSYDVFVAPVRGGRLGGKPRRLTFDSAHDLVCDWSPDGKNVLFTSTRSTSFPPALELYTVPADGSGGARRVTAFEGKEGTYSPDGRKIAYVRGPGTWYRKGYRGSANDDIWLCDADGSNNRQLTRFNGQDGSPMWAPDGKTLYYVSEFHGTANVVKQDIDGQKPPQLVTFHKDDGVRRARISRDGEWVVYECGADLWIASTREGIPARKLAIEVHADEKVNAEYNATFTRGASEFALNKEESHFVFAVHGELFLQKVAARAKAVRLTDHPAYDHGAQFSPKSDSIVFLSDRNGHENLYLLTPDDPEHPKLVDAHRFKVRQITDSPEAKLGASFSPDGKRIVYVRAGKLVSINPDGSGEKVLVGDGQVIDYEWSPDGKWIAVAKMDGTFASEVYIIPSDGGEARNVTRYATFNGGITWSHNGQKLAFLSDRRQGGTSLFVLSLQKPAAPGAPATKDIDWDDIHLRVAQPARLPIDEGAISPDGTKVAFRTTSFNGRGGSSDLWVATTDGQQLFRVTTGNRRPTQITWSKKPLDLLYFRDAEGKIRMARATPPSSPTSSPGTASALAEGLEIPFSVKMTIRRDEEFAEMFDQSWRALRENFYDKSFHGVDWSAVRGKYRPLVKHVAMKEDLQALISLMLGELNASHLGISSFTTPPEQTTADLGLLFDPAYRGPGLKVAEVLKRGPADKRGINLKAGDVILAIDGNELSAHPSLSKLLNDKAKETVTLSVLSSPTADPKNPKARRKVELQAATRPEVQKLMYERWVEANARRVSELSKGTLGYIHIPSMDEEGLDRFVRALYSDNVGKDAIVLDVRYNGGGFTHDQVLNYLGGREHTLFRQRDGGAGPVLRSADRKWSKPLVLLINNRSYSDAEIFPHAFRTLKLGKLVGQPTGAHVIGTSAVRLIDGSIFRIPRIGVYTDKGENMEKVGVTPDVVVEQTPDQFARGQDPQLDKAVEVVMQDVAVWKKTHGGGGVALKPDGGKPPTPVVGPLPPPGK